MSSSKSASVITLTFNPPATRWLLLLPAILVLLCAWFAVRWYVGDTLAEYAPAPDDGGSELAEMAVRWAPDDPLTHWRLANFEMRDFSAANINAAVEQYRLAVKASPYDFRYWVELGRALEASGDRDSAEKALRRAVELAPSYSYPQWHLGNVLLRQGKVDEAFTHLTRAAATDNAMQPPVFALSEQVYGNDINAITRVLPTPALRMQFALNLVNTNRFDEAARVLRVISDADQKTHSDIGDQIMQALLVKKQYRAALSILREIEPDTGQLPVLGQVWNGGFENDVPLLDPKPFRWQINSRPQTQISLDTLAHSGSRSLRIIFRAAARLDSIPASQTVIVEPDTNYRLQFYQRTEKLASGSAPFVTINDEVFGGPLAASPPAPAGTNDWQQVTLEFKTRAQGDGIAITFTRGNCGEPKEICPIFGTVWYDDFNLQRIGSPGASGRSAGTNNR